MQTNVLNPALSLLLLFGCTSDKGDTNGSDGSAVAELPTADTDDDSDSDADVDADTDADVDADADTDTNEGLDSGTERIDTGEPKPPDGWRSALFPDDWEPGLAIDLGDGAPVAQLQDFSYAGYRAGESPLPSLDDLASSATVSVTAHGADPSGGSDSTAAIQAAIDAVATDGGGIVLFPEGDYRIDGLLEVRQSGTILMGESTEATRLSFNRSDGMTDVNHLQFRGDRLTGESILLSDDVGIGQTVLPVNSVGDLLPGDTIGVGMVISDEWVTDHNMEGYWEFSLGARRTIFQRTVVAVDASATTPTVTIDVPIRYPMLVRDAADIRRESGFITECGIARMSLSSAVEWDAAWTNNRSHVLGFQNAQDCWAADLRSWEGLSGDGSHHLQSGGILLHKSRRVTVTDTTMEYAQNRGGGGNGYLFEIKQSDEVLIHGSVGRAGRHNFIQNWDFGSTGNVFLETLSELGESWTDSTGWIAPKGLSEYHHALAMANLVDASTAHDGWAAKNRLMWSSGAGHTATECVFWNMQGDGDLISLQYGRGYVIGTEGVSIRTEVTDFYDSMGTSPEDWVEGINEGATLWPPSLYREQLYRRGFGYGP